MLKPLLLRITPFRMSKGVIALLSPLSFHGSSILNAAIHNRSARSVVQFDGSISEAAPCVAYATIDRDG